jgi:predicted PurR-regulated permease PerM
MLLRGSVNQVVGLILTFYMQFYLLRDRGNSLKALIAYSPLTAAETMRVAYRFAETVRASIFGTIVVGLVQGSLGGLMFWWLGLPTPVFWALVMGVLAIFPFLGAFVVWVPAAVILVLQGEWASAALLSVWGGLIIATVDNLLYPILVGNRLRLHTLATFIGMVGGVILFGVAGIILGPAVIAITQEVIEILKQRSKQGSNLRQQNGVGLDAS